MHKSCLAYTAIFGSQGTELESPIEQSGQWAVAQVPGHDTILFQSLASNSPTTPPMDWRCLVGSTLLALELLHAQRLFLLHFSNLREELDRRILKKGCSGRDAEAHPDWLLTQVRVSYYACIRPLMPCISLHQLESNF